LARKSVEAGKADRRPQVERERIVSSVKSLESFPDCRNIKALSNHQYPYRLRIGDWRAFFSVFNSEITIITIEEVKKRDENTY